MLQIIAAGDFSFKWRADLKRWLLRQDGAGDRTLALRPGPFQIGRAPDCDLILPDSEALCLSTSRWHCHLLPAGEGWTIADGGLQALPETRAPKPSISGTFLDGRRVWKPEPLRPGATLEVGPWQFRVADSAREAVDIDHVLERIGTQSPVAIPEGNSASRIGFGNLDELFTRLYRIQDSDECLAAILAFAMEKIAPAQVAAVLTFTPEGAPSVRLAWQKGSGRLLDFRFSSGLLKSLPADRAFLLKAEIQDATRSQMEHRISSGLLVPLRGADGRLGVLYMDNRNHYGSFQEADLYLANALASVASLQLALERQGYLMRIEANMRQYFGPDVVRLIMEASRQGKPVSLGVKECEATVLFVDIQDFSAFCRGRSPHEVSELLNPYFEMAAEAIQGNGGHVDKFLGDGVMGVFGSVPLDDPRLTRANQAVQAVNAGRQMLARWAPWAQGRWGQPVFLRIGISTGRLVMGNIGFPGRIEYSALGDTVNLASRLEHLARPDGIAISEATYRMLGGGSDWVSGGEETIRGFGPVPVWRSRT